MYFFFEFFSSFPYKPLANTAEHFLYNEKGIDHMPERVEKAAEAVFRNPENNLAAGLLKAINKGKNVNR